MLMMATHFYIIGYNIEIKYHNYNCYPAQMKIIGYPVQLGFIIKRI